MQVARVLKSFEMPVQIGVHCGIYDHANALSCYSLAIGIVDVPGWFVIAVCENHKRQIDDYVAPATYEDNSLSKGLRMKPDRILGIEWSYEAGATHLGDGVYANHDGYQIVLRVDHGKYDKSIIALEPAVLKKLNEYADRLDRLDRLETERAS